MTVGGGGGGRGARRLRCDRAGAIQSIARSGTGRGENGQARADHAGYVGDEIEDDARVTGGAEITALTKLRSCSDLR